MSDKHGEDQVDARGFIEVPQTDPMNDEYMPVMSQKMDFGIVQEYQETYESFPTQPNETANSINHPLRTAPQMSQKMTYNKKVTEPKGEPMETTMKIQYDPLEEEDPTFVYNMSHPNRGRAIIVNNRMFEEHTRMKERNGTDIDAAYMYQTFKQLGFEVSLYNNLSSNSMVRLSVQVAAMDHSESDAFAYVVLSHGGSQGVVYGTDGTVSIDSLVVPFKGDKCKTLTGKPKLFFIQACRGTQFDEGVEMSDNMEEEKGARIPTEADFLMCYSTTPGYFSWRNSTKGSWFVQAICSIFSEYGNKKEIMWLMTKVNHTVAYNYQSNASQEFMNNKKQIPSIVSMLTKQLYFRPKK